MGQLRHIAISVSDLEKEAQFYEQVFGMTRLQSGQVGISLSDGVVNLTLLKFTSDAMAGDERGKDFVGLHHIGFVVDDLDTMDHRITESGGTFLRGPAPGMGTETKYRDPLGVVFDIATTETIWPGVKVEPE